MHKTIDLLNVKLGELINNNDSLGIDILETQAKNIILEKDKLIKYFNGDMDKTDEGLLGNEKIEDAIAALQQQPTQELLAHALTVVRRRMRENGQVIIAVEPNAAAGQMKLQAVKTSDGNSWWAVFTSFDEELKGGGSVMSTFMTDIGKVLEAALSEEEISGVIINPWNRTLMLDKTLIRIVLGDVTQ